MDKTKLLVLMTVFIDIIGIGIVIPVLPFYVEAFAGSPLAVTLLVSVYAFCSFISAPFIGSLSDRYGRRPALIGSIVSTSLGWFIFAAAPSLIYLFIGRIVDGIAAGNLPVAQSALMDISKDANERSRNLGLIGASFGIGFIIGPLIGGSLGHIGHSIPFWFVGVLSALNAVLAYFFLPETRKPGNTDLKPQSLNPFLPIVKAVRNKKLRNNYLAWAAFSFSMSTYFSISALYLGRAFGFQEFAIGMIMTASGVVIALNQSFLMRHFWLKHFPEPALELWLLLVFSAGYLLVAMPFVKVFYAGMIISTLSQSVLRVVMNSRIVSEAAVDERGEVLGIVSSIINFAAFLAPLLSGWLFTQNIRWPLYVSAIFGMAAFSIVLISRKKPVKPLSDEFPVLSEL